MVTAAATAGLFTMATLSAVVAFVTWRRQVREQRGRWLTELLRQFSNDRSFKAIRSDLYQEERCQTSALLTRKNELKLSRAADQALTHEEAAFLMRFDNYVGFFELIEHLVAGKQMEVSDASAMFGWYVGQLVENENVRDEVAENFFPVVELARRMGYRHEAAKALATCNRLIYEAASEASLDAARFYCECGKRTCDKQLGVMLTRYPVVGRVYARRHEPKPGRTAGDHA